MTSYVPVIKNGAAGAILYTALFPRTATGQFQTNPTLAAGDVKISIDGGAYANLATLPDAEPNATQSVRIILSQAETNGDNLCILFVDAAGAEWCDQLITIDTVAANFDTIKTETAAILADTGTDGVVLANDAITAAKIDAGAGTEIGTAVWASAARTLTALDEDSTTIDLDATIAAAVPSAAVIADAVWDEDATGHQTGGTFGQAIGDPAADTTTIYGAVVTGAAGTHVAADIIAIKAETAAIVADTGTDGVVLANDAITAAKVAVGAIAADAFAAGAIDAAAIAADAGTELADAFLNRDMATGTDSGSTTVRTVRQALRLNRNKVAISAGTMTVYKEDDATSSWTSAVTTDAAAEPIISSDPAGP